MSETSFNVTTRCPKTGNVCSLLLCSSGTAINCQLYPGPNNPDMFDDKTSQQEIKNQIGYLSDSDASMITDMISEQDKVATNRTIDAAIVIFKSPWPDGEWVIKELEKLRRV